MTAAQQIRDATSIDTVVWYVAPMHGETLFIWYRWGMSPYWSDE